eukprot:gene22758-31048_t
MLGDYSFLIDSIEGKIQQTLPPGVQQDDNSYSASYGTKRDIITPKKTLLEDSADYTGGEKKRSRDASFEVEGSGGGGRLSISSVDRRFREVDNSGDNILNLALIDELKLENERLMDELNRCKSDKEFKEERMMRQLLYLEEQNKKLKQDVSISREKYFDDKKKWQALLRESDNKLSEQSKKSHPAMVAENKQNLVAKVVAENKLDRLQRELASFKALSADTVEEMRLLRVSAVELELALKKKSRESEKTEKALKNQLASSSSTIASLEAIVRDLQQAGSDNKRLLSERSEWTTLFSTIMSLEENEKEVSPATVLASLSSLQKKFSLLSKQLGDAETSQAETRRQLLRSELKVQELTSANLDLAAQLERADRQGKLEVQRTKIFEGEVLNLRALLKTYDVEFSIGRPESSTALAMKDEQVRSLRSELDSCRQQMMTMLASQQRSDPQTEIKDDPDKSDALIRLAAEKAALLEDLEALKMATGMDYLQLQQGGLAQDIAPRITCFREAVYLLTGYKVIPY